MAFRQPTFAPPQRQTSITHDEQATQTALQYTGRAVDESQEWVLFSPTQAPSTTQTYTTFTQRTAGLSRLSDFGSNNTAGRSAFEGDGLLATESLQDDEELDSLDDGLHDFGEPSVYQSSRFQDQTGNSILPTHDGLGTFPASSPPAQEQMWQFEQFNPRKRSAGHHRRRSSVLRRLDAIKDEDSASVEGEKLERIEKWRMEQSRALLQEIEKETKSRKIDRTSEPAKVLTARIKDHIPKHSATSTVDAPANGIVDLLSDGNEWFLKRITRNFIRDLIGIDEPLLSIILGESFLDEKASAQPPAASKALPNSTPPSYLSSTGWESRLLQRIAHELGILVHQFSEHPSPFSTYLNPSSLAYAGMPINPPLSPEVREPPSFLSSANQSSIPSAVFGPTLQNHPSTASTHAASWGIEDPPPRDPETEYWEQPADLRTVFHFLHHRFTSPPHTPTTAKPNIATSSSPDSLRRAAVIRQHHPLVSRAAARDRQQRRSTYLRHQSPIMSRRQDSSCASASARRRWGSGGSRNFWDLGGSVGSGSAIASGGLGGWGEV